MKKSFAVLFAALTIVMFGSCVKEDAENVSFTAAVIAAERDYLEVEPAEDAAERRSADRIIVSQPEGTLYLDADGQETARPEFSVGQEIRIVYDGTIAESYPAQIRAIEIHLTESEG